MRWWTTINSKNYDILSKIIIKTPRPCTIRCYSVSTTDILFFITIVSILVPLNKKFLNLNFFWISWPSIQTIGNVNIYNLALMWLFCSTAKGSLSNFVSIPSFMLLKRAVYNGISLKLKAHFDFQQRT